LGIRESIVLLIATFMNNIVKEIVIGKWERFDTTHDLLFNFSERRMQCFIINTNL